ncbi:MAG: hypothetical protein LBR68_00005, partial [Lachnoclostridium sp.]|nr:hypothetical protein [Lachnoclostridium sp.]
MRTKVKTTTIEMQRWQTDLFVSLFNGDGGGGFEDEEILQAQEFIRENNLLSMVEIEEMGET